MPGVATDDPDLLPPLTGPLRVVAAVGVVAVVIVGIVLRFFTHSALWLDEALTVDIARLPLHQIPDALKHDGAPPLFYVLLHFWMKVFGQSDLATRSLSGVIGVAALVVAWFAGLRLGGRWVAWTTVVLLASAPFAVFYATEARMYSLVILLTGCGYLALRRAAITPRPGNLIAVAVVTAALLYSQYWSLYLVVAVGLWFVLSAAWSRWRSSDPSAWKAPLPALGAVAVGALAFVPWVPTFLYQGKHTGTPWSTPAGFAATINVVTSFTANQGSNSTLGTVPGRLLAIVYFAGAGLALFGIARSRRVVELDWATRPRARALTFVVLVTLIIAITGGLLSSSAFSSRYTAVVFLPLLMLVALGTTTVLGPLSRVVVVTAALVAGLVISFQNVNTQRTQATQIAAVLNAQARPGDVIAFCPDQLGPAVYRQVVAPGRYRMLTFPRGIAPQIVDWVDYAKASAAGDPAAFASGLTARAGPTHRVWLAWATGYQTFGTKCEDLAGLLAASPKRDNRTWVTASRPTFYEPMNLTEYSPTAGS